MIYDAGVNGEVSVGGRGGHGLVALIVGMSPLWIGLFLALATPTFVERMDDAKVAIAGLPAGWFLILASLILAISGAIAIWKARSTVVVVAALVLLTFPALVLVIMGPALVLIVENVGNS